MLIAKGLRDSVEGYVRANSRYEVGGVFLGDDERLLFFVPLPNVSEDDKTSTYLSGRNALEVADLLGKISGLEIVAGMHSHPNGSVVSEADLRWLERTSHKFGVVVANKGTEMEWFCIAKNGQNQPIFWSDEEHAMVALLLAKKMGLIDLGHVMLTPVGDLLCENDEARVLLSIDKDVLAVRRLIAGRDKWNQPTKKEIAEKTKLSRERVAKALAKIGG